MRLHVIWWWKKTNNSIVVSLFTISFSLSLFAAQANRIIIINWISNSFCMGVWISWNSFIHFLSHSLWLCFFAYLPFGFQWNSIPFIIFLCVQCVRMSPLFLIIAFRCCYSAFISPFLLRSLKAILQNKMKKKEKKFCQKDVNPFICGKFTLNNENLFSYLFRSFYSLRFLLTKTVCLSFTSIRHHAQPMQINLMPTKNLSFLSLVRLLFWRHSYLVSKAIAFGQNNNFKLLLLLKESVKTKYKNIFW